jgi:hypothetical protein
MHASVRTAFQQSGHFVVAIVAVKIASPLQANSFLYFSLVLMSRTLPAPQLSSSENACQSQQPCVREMQCSMTQLQVRLQGSRYITARVALAACLKGSSSTLSNRPQGHILASFRKGKTNVVFATSIAEEGLDIQHCSLVICYDTPARPLSVVQTVGRARAHDAKVLFLQAVDEVTGCRDRVRWTLSMSSDFYNHPVSDCC